MSGVKGPTDGGSSPRDAAADPVVSTGGVPREESATEADEISALTRERGQVAADDLREMGALGDRAVSGETVLFFSDASDEVFGPGILYSGATDLADVLGDPDADVPTNIHSPEAPHIGFFQLYSLVISYLEDMSVVADAIVGWDDFFRDTPPREDADSIGPEDGVDTPAEVREKMEVLATYMDQSEELFIRAYEKWWRLTSEEVTLTNLRTERLEQDIYDAYRTAHLASSPGNTRVTLEEEAISVSRSIPSAVEPQYPWVVKIANPMSQWNKESVLGQLAATRMNWDMVRVLKQHVSTEVGRVTFIDSTGISLTIRGDQNINEVVNHISRSLPGWLEIFWASLVHRPLINSSLVRRGSAGLEIKRDNNTWAPSGSLLPINFFVGVERVGEHIFRKRSSGVDFQLLRLDPRENPREEDVRRAAHTAEMFARAKAEQIKRDFEAGDTSERIFINGTVDESLLGKGYFPEFGIPTEENIYQGLLEIGLRHSFARPKDLPRTPSDARRLDDFRRIFALKIKRFEGLNRIYRIAQEVHNLGTVDGIDFGEYQPEDYVRHYLEDTRPGSTLTDFRDHSSHTTQLLVQGIEHLAYQPPHSGSFLYLMHYAGSEIRMTRWARMFAGPVGPWGQGGAISALRKKRAELNKLLEVHSWDRTHASEAQRITREINEVLLRVKERVEKYMSKALYDTRFPGKIKSEALFYVVDANMDKEARGFTYIVLDYDRMKAFMAAQVNTLNPQLRFDWVKYNIERTIRLTAESFGLTMGRNCFYASPGGDEIQIIISDNVRAEDFVSRLRETVDKTPLPFDRSRTFSKVTAHAEWKVKIPGKEGETLERWLVFKNNGQGVAVPRHFVNETTQALVDNAPDTIPVFRIVSGLFGGGYLDTTSSREITENYQADIRSIGISAAYVYESFRWPHESFYRWNGRMQAHTQLGFGLLDEVKTERGRDQTWSVRQELVGRYKNALSIWREWAEGRARGESPSPTLSKKMEVIAEKTPRRLREMAEEVSKKRLEQIPLEEFRDWLNSRDANLLATYRPTAQEWLWFMQMSSTQAGSWMEQQMDRVRSRDDPVEDFVRRAVALRGFESRASLFTNEAFDRWWTGIRYSPQREAWYDRMFGFTDQPVESSYDQFGLEVGRDTEAIVSALDNRDLSMPVSYVIEAFNTIPEGGITREWIEIELGYYALSAGGFLEINTPLARAFLWLRREANTNPAYNHTARSLDNRLRRGVLLSYEEMNIMQLAARHAMLSMEPEAWAEYLETTPYYHERLREHAEFFRQTAPMTAGRFEDAVIGLYEAHGRGNPATLFSLLNTLYYLRSDRAIMGILDATGNSVLIIEEALHARGLPEDSRPPTETMSRASGVGQPRQDNQTGTTQVTIATGTPDVTSQETSGVPKAMAINFGNSLDDPSGTMVMGTLALQTLPQVFYTDPAEAMTRGAHLALVPESSHLPALAFQLSTQDVDNALAFVRENTDEILDGVDEDNLVNDLNLRHRLSPEEVAALESIQAQLGANNRRAFLALCALVDASITDDNLNPNFLLRMSPPAFAASYGVAGPAANNNLYYGPPVGSNVTHPGFRALATVGR